MPFDLRTALRSIKPEKRTKAFVRRDDAELTWVDDVALIGGPLLLDACVYLDTLQGKTPEAVDQLLTSRRCHHSAVCLSELTHVFGRLDPLHPGSEAVLEIVREMLDDIPPHRLHAPDTDHWGMAGILAGLAVRLLSLPKNAGHERRFLNDALILLQARALGAAVLTANVRDFDCLAQLAGDVRVINYRTAQ